jgi:hypothetical protein
VHNLLIIIGVVATCLLLRVLHKQNIIIKKVNNMSVTLDQLLAKVQEETTLETSIIAMLGSIKAQLDAALSAELTPAAQAKVDAIFAALEANTSNLSAAVAANTPAAPTP